VKILKLIVGFFAGNLFNYEPAESAAAELQKLVPVSHRHAASFDGAFQNPCVI
jgi:hypothetical protein